jgi:hypothetical protein
VGEAVGEAVGAVVGEVVGEVGEVGKVGKVRWRWDGRRRRSDVNIIDSAIRRLQVARLQSILV